MLSEKDGRSISVREYKRSSGMRAWKDGFNDT